MRTTPAHKHAHRAPALVRYKNSFRFRSEHTDPRRPCAHKGVRTKPGGLPSPLLPLRFAALLLSRSAALAPVYSIVRVPKPSLFAIVALLILLALGVWANMHIARMDFGFFTWTTHDAQSPSPSVRWPTIPDEVFDNLGTPTNWTRRASITHTELDIDWVVGVPDPQNQLSSSHHQLTETRSGFPLTARTTKHVYSDQGCYMSMTWPTKHGRMHSAHITHHPLGLIANPILYAMPPWCVLLLARRKVVRVIHRRRQRRLDLGLCDHCDYEVKDLPTCPECGHPNLSQPQPVSA